MGKSVTLSAIANRLGILFVFNIVALASCNSEKRASAQGSNPSQFRVALLTPGPISDQAWNQRAYEGLVRIRDSLGAEISHVEAATPAQFEENFRAYGAKGFDLVFGHGSEFQDAALRVSAEFPKTVYVTTGGNAAVGNAVGIEFAFEEGSYVAGMVAGALTKSNTIGCIGGTELPPVKRSFEAFVDGAKAVNPKVRVLIAYIGNWEDASAGREQAIAQIGRGADVIFGNADAAGLGIFQAVRESRSALVIGANADQAHVAPEAVIGSVVIDIPHAFLSVAREIRAGRFTPRVISFGTRSDVVRWVYNPALEHRVPPSAHAQVESVTAHIRDGTFSVRPRSAR